MLRGLLREVGFTSLSKEMARHLGQNLWPQDPGTVRDIRRGKDRGSWLQTWPGGGGGGGTHQALNCSCEPCGRQGPPSAAAGRPCPPWATLRAWCLRLGARNTVCAHGCHSHCRKSREPCGDGQESAGLSGELRSRASGFLAVPHW